MRTGLVVLAACVAASSVAGCVQNRNRGYYGRGGAGAQPAPVIAKPAPATARPFNAMPTVALADTQQTGPMYRVQIVAEITRDVMPTDDLAIIIAVDDHEVGRYPIVGTFERTRRTLIKQEIELPRGDYEIEYDYRGTRYAGLPFRIAEVPVWGGRRALQLRQHPGTRVSLREKKLWVGRWWANDGPPQAWIVEWAHEGKVITATSGREQHGIPANTRSLVGGAAGAYHADRVVSNTIWTYGEQYAVPDVVVNKPGAWAARVVHGNSAPISIVFNVLPNGRLAEANTRRIHSAGWEESWSKRLEQRALSVTEVDRLTAKLPQLSSTQPFDDLQPMAAPGPEAPVRVSTAAVRALFRSKQLAEAWWQFENLNVASANANARAPGVDATAFPKSASARKPGMPASRDAAIQSKQAAREEAERRSKLRALRIQIESLIKAHGGPWKSDEFPRS